MARTRVIPALLAALVAGCSAGVAAPSAGTTLLFAGDVMLGRGVAPVVAADPDGLFEGIRFVVEGAGLAMANLESPLTTAPHRSPSPHMLGADPVAAGLIAAAGFDVLSVANNHAGDAGPEGVADTLDALEAAGIVPAGPGGTVIVESDGLRVAVLAFDATGSGPHAPWDPAIAEPAVRRARAVADVVTVSIHGGVEYLPEPDPRIVAIAERLAGWGADVVWGHGPHVVHPVWTADPDGDGRPTILAPSLGNLLFDQRGPRTGEGMVLEVMVDARGVIAYRQGSTSHRDLRAGFDGWLAPAGDAAHLRGGWWQLASPVAAASTPAELREFEWGEVVTAARGPLLGPGSDTVVVSFRKPAAPHPVRDGLPGVRWVDGRGRTSHLGVYHPDLTPIWVAGAVPAPVAGVAVCEGALALSYSTLDDPTVVATGGARWTFGGLVALDRLDGAGVPGCLDVDGDGRTDPVITGR
jgi:poly-gamma-glutamate capsule biosynthesis protein CapA/YwtB (metallophosphatase superfamily)